MAEERIYTLTVKVPLVPEEGIDGEWEITKGRFAEDVHPLPIKEAARMTGRMYRADNTVYLNGEVSTTLEFECSRCLTKVDFPVTGEIAAVFMPRAEISVSGDEVELTGEDMDVQLYDGDEIDLYITARDFIALSVPLQPLCSEDCKGLCPVCGVDRNEKECGCETREIDTRFAVLKNLKL